MSGSVVTLEALSPESLAGCSTAELAELYSRRVFLDLLAQPEGSTLIAAGQKAPKLNPAARIAINVMMKAVRVWRKPGNAQLVESAPTDTATDPAQPIQAQATGVEVPVAASPLSLPDWELLAAMGKPLPNIPIQTGLSSASSRKLPPLPGEPMPPWLLQGKPHRKKR